MLNRLLSAVMGLSYRRPLIVGASVLILAVAGGVLALRMQPTAETRTLVGPSTPGYEATEDLGERFGSDAVYVFIREPVTDLVLTDDLGKAAALEGCLAVRSQVRNDGGVGYCSKHICFRQACGLVFEPPSNLGHREALRECHLGVGDRRWRVQHHHDVSHVGSGTHRVEPGFELDSTVPRHVPPEHTGTRDDPLVFQTLADLIHGVTLDNREGFSRRRLPCGIHLT